MVYSVNFVKRLLTILIAFRRMEKCFIYLSSLKIEMLKQIFGALNCIIYLLVSLD